MSTLRSSLLSALAEVARGGDVDHDELVVIASPDDVRGSLSLDEGQAYWALWRWADDGDIRAKERDGVYALAERIKIINLHNRLAELWKARGEA